MRANVSLAVVACLLAVSPCKAHQAQTTSPEPGFRPESATEQQFLADLGDAEIVVYPTMVRRTERTAHSFASQAQIIEFLNREGIGRAVATRRRIDRGQMVPDSQWNIFQSGIAAVADHLAGHPVAADYVLALEILVPGDEAVFGIECYILTPAGESAFSFLLNEHNRMFVEAELVAGGSQAARDAMISRATLLAMDALERQLTNAAQGIGEVPPPERPDSDTVDDFERDLRRTMAQYGISLGFITFAGDPDTSVQIRTTATHPPVPGQHAGNSVLQLDVEVHSWAGVAHRFADATGRHWLAYDWTGATEISFWLYGRETGAMLSFDVFDNRHAYSITNDPECYSFTFSDDFSGWRLISIPFEVMVRKEIGNFAPQDGLGLAAAHGWGFAVSRTQGAVTYYLDDVSLRRTPLMDDVPAGLSRENDIWVPINELPMFGDYEPTEWQERANEQFVRMVLPDFDGDRGKAAEHFARTAWNTYYAGDSRTAIRRFNQAWLLDPGNQHALWGFAVVERERGKRDAALRFYRMALDAGTGADNPKLKSEYESLLGNPGS